MQNSVGPENLCFEKWVVTYKVWEPPYYVISRASFIDLKKSTLLTSQNFA